MPALRTLTIQMLLLTAFAMTATAVTFDVPTEYSVGDSPNRICSADFNGDGHLDLAVTRLNSDLYPDPDPNNAVMILINNGDGTFATPVVYSAGDEPFAICAADVDGDGDFDIIVTNLMSIDNGTPPYAPGYITVLKNDGDGVFTLSSTCETTFYCLSMCAADFDGDMDIDVAALSLAADSVCVLLNDGAGAFSRDTTFAVGSYHMGICSGDLDGDGDKDLVVGFDENNTGITVFTNDGSAVFAMNAQYLVGEFPTTICLADFDNDGDLDIAVAVQAADRISILINEGDATFASAVHYPVQIFPYGLCTADFDGDGFVDLAVTCHILNSVSILTNNGDGTFTVDSEYASGVFPICVAAGDFDGDGLSDMVVVDRRSDCIRVFINNTVVSDIADEFTPAELPANFQLRQNYPNPFNPSTTIAFDLPGRSIVEITVYNISGQAVRRLVNAELGAGTHTVEWDGTNDFGQPVATGIYLCHFKAGDITAVKKMALLK